MTVNVNLLPISYRRARSHERWFRRGVAVWLGFVVVELVVGLCMNVRTVERHELTRAVAEAREAIGPLRHDLTVTNREAAHMARRVALSRELRTKHRWSRLLTVLANATPANVMLNGVRTDPAKWLARRQFALRSRTIGEKEDDAPAPALQGIVISGCATDHEALTRFMSRIHELHVFATIDLRRMTRDTFEDAETVSFELRAHW